MFRTKTKDGTTRLDGAAPLTIATAINLFYPVGSLYLSTSATNPGTFFPGTTWVAWGAGRAVVGVGNNGSNSYTVEQTWGADSITLSAAQCAVNAHSHTLGGSTGGRSAGHTHNGPSHSHELDWNYVTGVNPSGTTLKFAVSIGGTFNSDGADSTGNTEAAGTGATSGETVDHSHTLPSTTGAVNAPTAATSHDNRQPSIATYIWKRTA
jgi:hypothetical protein